MKETQENKQKVGRKETRCNNQKRKINSKRKNNIGITLIALVVTVVVLLILSGITIQTAIGDGGIIDLANRAKEEQIIATYKDRISIVGLNWSLKRALNDSVTVEDLWQDMQDAKIIENKDTNVEKLDENGNYIITVPEGYKFQIHINEYDDVEVEYIGKGNSLLPYIQDITVISQTSNSVELQISVSRLNGGSLSYYYKVKGEPEESYQIVKENTTDLTVKIEGLTAKTTYEIKVKATNENGTTEKIKEVLIGELKGTINQKGETEWSNGKATIHLETETQNVSIMYQINGIEGNYLPYDDEQGITNLEHGDKVYAVLSDGNNITDYTSIDIIDEEKPQNANISLSGTTTNTAGSITATVTHIDNESGIEPTNCKWIYNTSANPIGIEESSYLNAFNSNGQTITLNATTPGTYYLHVLTIDKAGNKIETISQGITVTQLVTGITVSPTSITLEEGKTQQLSITITPNNASNKTVTWSSDNTTVASVNSSTGLVTAIAEGGATITARAVDGSGVTGTCKVTVESAGIPVEDILKVGDYVTYPSSQGDLECRVLYDSSSGYGVQIITSDIVGNNITLGSNGSFTTSMNSYNNAVNTLNTEAGKYNNSTYSNRARCVGSHPTSTTDNPGYFTSSYSSMLGYNGMFKNADNNYITDYNQMETLGMLPIKKKYWLASRYVSSRSFNSSFYVRLVGTSGSLGNDDLCSMYDTGDKDSFSYTYGLRPVFILKSGITEMEQKKVHIH